MNVRRTKFTHLSIFVEDEDVSTNDLISTVTGQTVLIKRPKYNGHIQQDREFKSIVV